MSYETDALTEWNKRTARLEADRQVPTGIAKRLGQVLPIDGEMTCLEVGALPGTYLAHVHEAFGYSVTGIDFADNSAAFHRTMAARAIDDYEFIKDDFLSHTFGRHFDVVMSFGFIEHFDELQPVVERHCSLVAPGGFLVLSVPNFRYLQYAYHLIFDRSNLRIHNREAMNPKLLRELVTAHGFRELLAVYTGTFELWREDHPLATFMRILDSLLRRGARILGKLLPPARFYSPHLLTIYQLDRDGSDD